MPHRLTYDALFEVFYASEKPKSDWRIGTESEKFGVYSDLTPLMYDGTEGIEGIFNDLITKFRWVPEQEYEGGPVIALKRNNADGSLASITLEPACQLELSGAPLKDIEDIAAEFDDHLRELKTVCKDREISWMGVGFHPWATHAMLPWVPKMRYSVMRDYLPHHGTMALDMMRRTCTVQSNLDYCSEDDAMRKLQLALRIQPIVTAMFANSPWVEGKATGERSHRAQVWLNVDPDRTGLLPFMWKNLSMLGYRDYVEWALDVPMFMIKRGADSVPNTGQTFREFMRDGFQGHHATLEDWEKHLSTLFPEVRIKNTIEVRGVDAQGRELYPALPAFWKGLMHSEKAIAAMDQLTQSLTYQDMTQVRPQVAVLALDARLQNQALRAWAEQLVDIAEKGLPDHERRYLAPLKQLVSQGKTPADLLLERTTQATRFEDMLALVAL